MINTTKTPKHLAKSDAIPLTPQQIQAAKWVKGMESPNPKGLGLPDKGVRILKSNLNKRALQLAAEMMSPQIWPTLSEKLQVQMLKLFIKPIAVEEAEAKAILTASFFDDVEDKAITTEFQDNEEQ